MIRTRSFELFFSIGRRHDFPCTAAKHRYSAQNAVKLLQGLTYANAPARLQFEFTNGFFVAATSFFNHRYRLSDLACRFEISQVQHSVRQVAKVYGGLRGGDQPVLRQNENGQNALVIQISDNLVKLIGKVLLAGHRVEISIEGVDHHEFAASGHLLLNASSEFAGRNLRGIHLLYGDGSAFNVLFQIKPQCLGASEHDRTHFIKGEEYRPVTL